MKQKDECPCCRKPMRFEEGSYFKGLIFVSILQHIEKGIQYIFQTVRTPTSLYIMILCGMSISQTFQNVTRYITLRCI